LRAARQANGVGAIDLGTEDGGVRSAAYIGYDGRAASEVKDGAPGRAFLIFGHAYAQGREVECESASGELSLRFEGYVVV
jgi:hypothetical protein